MHKMKLHIIEKYVAKLAVIIQVRDELADFLDIDIEDDDERLNDINNLISSYTNEIHIMTK